MDDNSTKMFCTLGIWTAVACIFIFGVFDHNFDGVYAITALVLIVVSICIAAAIATSAVWRASMKQPTSIKSSGLPASQKAPAEEGWQHSSE